MDIDRKEKFDDDGFRKKMQKFAKNGKTVDKEDCTIPFHMNRLCKWNCKVKQLIFHTYI